MNFDDLDPERLRQRRSAKWLHYGPELLPCWVAEMDYAVAPAIRAELQRAIEYDDYGYPAYSREQLVAEAFAERMAQRFAWRVDPGEVVLLTEVVQGMYLSLLALTARSHGVRSVQHTGDRGPVPKRPVVLLAEIPIGSPCSAQSRSARIVKPSEHR